jgi:hypothetical protein
MPQYATWRQSDVYRGRGIRRDNYRPLYTYEVIVVCQQ